MRQHHPDTGDGDTKKLDEARSAYIQLKDKSIRTALTVDIVVPSTQEDLASYLGKQIRLSIMVPFLIYLFSIETRMGDTITVKNIIPDTTIKVKFREKNE